MLRFLLTVMLLTAGLAGQVQAALTTYTYSGGAVAIPNNNASGVSLDINVTDTLDLFQFNSITISGSHTWIGDLVMTLTHVPSGNTIDLIRRPGKSLAGSGFGDSSNWAGFTFSNVNTLSNVLYPRVIDNAHVGGTATAVVNGIYRPTTNIFNGNGPTTNTGETITDLNAVFDPISNINGIWRLTVFDLAASDTGTITGFSITMDVGVPEPSSALLLGGVLAAGAGVRLRRRKPAPVAASPTHVANA